MPPLPERPHACARLEHTQSRHIPNVSQLGPGPAPLGSIALEKLGVPAEISKSLAEVGAHYRMLLQMVRPFSCGISGADSHAADCTHTSGCRHGDFDVVVLATHPRSGTGWTQTIYAATMGLSFEAVYNNTGTVKSSYGTFYTVGDPRFRRPHGDEPVFVKSHFPDWGCPPPGFGPKTCFAARVVHIMRNPLDQVVASWGAGIHGVGEKMRNASWEIPPALYADWVASAPLHTRAYVRFHCRVAAAFRERPRLLVRYDDMIADSANEFSRLLQFVVGPARAPPINKIKEQLGMSGVKHVSPTTELRGGFPVYATQSQLVTPAVVDSIAAVLRTALPLGVWANAMAAGNDTQLIRHGANPLYPWKVAGAPKQNQTRSPV